MGEEESGFEVPSVSNVKLKCWKAQGTSSMMQSLKRGASSTVMSKVLKPQASFFLIIRFASQNKDSRAHLEV